MVAATVAARVVAVVEAVAAPVPVAAGRADPFAAFVVTAERFVAGSSPDC